jgi:hypothetical protein
MRAPESLPNRDERICTTAARQLKVHQLMSGLWFAELSNRLDRITCLQRQFHVRLGGNDGGQAFAKNWVMLHAQYANSPRFSHAGKR